jgi:hypothetical protein
MAESLPNEIRPRPWEIGVWKLSAVSMIEDQAEFLPESINSTIRNLSPGKKKKVFQSFALDLMDKTYLVARWKMVISITY